MVAMYESLLGQKSTEFSIGPSMRASRRTGKNSLALLFVTTMLKKRPGSLMYIPP